LKSNDEQAVEKQAVEKVRIERIRVVDFEETGRPDAFEQRWGGPLNKGSRWGRGVHAFCESGKAHASGFEVVDDTH
jgi:hypothetical protein